MTLPRFTRSQLGAWWHSGRVLDSRSRGGRFEPHGGGGDITLGHNEVLIRY